MVGIPGRSKGCNTCIKRSIACTLERPYCAKCTKSNLQCGGYQRQRIWLVNQVSDENSTAPVAKPRFKTYRRSLNTAARKSPNPVSTGDISMASVPFAATIKALVEQVGPQALFRQQFFSQFLSTYIPDIDRVNLGGEADGVTWLLLFPEILSPPKALDTAMLSVSIARLGRLRGDEGLIKESMKLYGQGLRELQHALWDPKSMYRDETLAACMALAMYEIIECPSQAAIGWVTHSNGCARLVRLRGAAAHTSKFARSIFLSFRVPGIMQAIQQRRTTYLSDPEWTSLTWKEDSSRIDCELLDIMATVPLILEQADQFQDREHERIHSASYIVTCLWMLDTRLKLFYEQLELDGKRPLYSSEASTMFADSEIGNVFPVAFHFRDLQTAHICELYWIVSIVLWSTMAHVYKYIQNDYRDDGETLNSERDQLPSLQHRVDTRPLTRNICQSIEYCIQEDMKSLGAGTTLIPLNFAAATFKNDPSCTREVNWVSAAMRKAEERGFRIMKYCNITDTRCKEKSECPPRFEQVIDDAFGGIG